MLSLTIYLGSAVSKLCQDTQAHGGFKASQDDKVLLEIARKCGNTARELQTELNDLKSPGGGIRAAMKKTFRAVGSRRKISQKTRDLEEYQKALDTRILTRLDFKATESSRDFDSLQKHLHSMDLTIERSNNNILKILSKRIDRAATRQKFMESFYFADIFTRQEQIPDSHRETFEWIFTSSQQLEQEAGRYHWRRWSNFRDWLEFRDPLNYVYHIHGKVGSGKSTLMNYVVQDARTSEALRKWCGSTAILLIPTFFFWSAGTAVQKSVQGLLRSVIYQILMHEPNLLEDLLTSLSKSGSQSLDGARALTTRWLLSVHDILLPIMAARRIYVCFFVDGLDEYDGEKDILLDWINAMAKYENVKICVSSRPEEPYRRHFEHMPQLRLQDLTYNDIQTFIRARLEGPLFKSLGYDKPDSPQRDPYQLMEEIQRKASGVFLWVRLVTRDLRTHIDMGDTMKDLWRKLGDIPDEIHDLYNHMLGNVTQRALTYAKTYFTLMLANDLSTDYSRKAIILDFALTEEPEWNRLHKMDKAYFDDGAVLELCSKLEVRINSCCAGLVEIEDLRDKDPFSALARRVDFIHRSVFDFLKEKRVSPFVGSIDYGALLMTRAWIGHCAATSYYGSYKCLEPFQIFKWSTGRSNSFIQYSGEVDVRYGLQLLANQALFMEDVAVYGDDPRLRAPCNEAILKIRDILQSSNKRDLPSPFYSRAVLRGKPLEDMSHLSRPFDDELEIWAYFGFERAMQCLKDNQDSASAYWNQILGWISAGSTRWDTSSQLFYAALRRGAVYSDSLDLRFPESRSKSSPIASFVQNSWAEFICQLTLVHATNIFHRHMEAQDYDRFIHCTLDIIRECLCRGLDHNRPYLLPLDQLGGSSVPGYFLAEISIQSYIDSCPDFPCKKDILQELVGNGTQAFRRLRFYVDCQTEAVYELTENLMSSFASNGCDLLDDFIKHKANILFDPSSLGTNYIDQNEKYARAVLFAKERVLQARKLGHVHSGLVIGDERTYEHHLEFDR